MSNCPVNLGLESKMSKNGFLASCQATRIVGKQAQCNNCDIRSAIEKGHDFQPPAGIEFLDLGQLKTEVSSKTIKKNNSKPSQTIPNMKKRTPQVKPSGMTKYKATGVSYRDIKSGGGTITPYYVASINLGGKQKQKAFSIRKSGGHKAAFDLACQWRKEMESGYGKADTPTFDEQGYQENIKRLGDTIERLKKEIDQLSSSPETLQEYSCFQALALQIGALVDQKQAAYGDSFGKSGQVMRILYPAGIAPEQIDDALCVVRIVDKLFRIATDKNALGESPYRDISGYGLLGAARSEVAHG